jgi:hypothetical protein
MTYRAHDTVVLDRDLPDHALRQGDLRAVVEVYEPDGLEVAVAVLDACFVMSRLYLILGIGLVWLECYRKVCRLRPRRGPSRGHHARLPDYGER